MKFKILNFIHAIIKKINKIITQNFWNYTLNNLNKKLNITQKTYNKINRI